MPKRAERFDQLANRGIPMSNRTKDRIGDNADEFAGRSKEQSIDYSQARGWPQGMSREAFGEYI